MASMPSVLNSEFWGLSRQMTTVSVYCFVFSRNRSVQWQGSSVKMTLGGFLTFQENLFLTRKRKHILFFIKKKKRIRRDQNS